MSVDDSGKKTRNYIMNASAAQAIEDAAYVARILEDSLRLSQMFDDGNKPDELATIIEASRP